MRVPCKGERCAPMTAILQDKAQKRKTMHGTHAHSHHLQKVEVDTLYHAKLKLHLSLCESHDFVSCSSLSLIRQATGIYS